MSEKPIPWHGVALKGMEWIAVCPIPERKRIALCIVSENEITWTPVAYFMDEAKARRFLELLGRYVYKDGYEEQVRKFMDRSERDQVPEQGGGDTVYGTQIT